MDQPRAAWESKPRAALPRPCAYLLAMGALCVALYFPSDSSQGNYKLQQTEKAEKSILPVYRQAEKNGVRSEKSILSYSWNLTLVDKECRTGCLCREKVEGLG